MDVFSAKTSRLRDVVVTVGDFSGPLDLLLSLIQSQQMPITTLSLQAVTEQFLAALTPIEQAQPELLADFLVVASRLTALKARSLLPHPPSEPAAKDELVLDLQGYQALRQAAHWLQVREARGLRSWPRPPQPQPRSPISSHPPEVLQAALWRLLRRTQPIPQLLRLEPILSFSAMVERISTSLSGRQSFRAVLGAPPRRGEVVIGLLAVLTLARREILGIEQEEPFGEIWIWPKQGTKA